MLNKQDSRNARIFCRKFGIFGIGFIYLHPRLHLIAEFELKAVFTNAIRLEVLSKTTVSI